MIEDAYLVLVEVKQMELFGSIKVNEFFIDCAGVIKKEAMCHLLADKTFIPAMHDNAFKTLRVKVDYLIILLLILLLFSLH